MPLPIENFDRKFEREVNNSQIIFKKKINQILVPFPKKPKSIP